MPELTLTGGFNRAVDFSCGNSASRAYPAGGRRKLPPAAANPRRTKEPKPCWRRKYPPDPA
jgi:hypothetical protein